MADTNLNSPIYPDHHALQTYFNEQCTTASKNLDISENINLFIDFDNIDYSQFGLNRDISVDTDITSPKNLESTIAHSPHSDRSSDPPGAEDNSHADVVGTFSEHSQNLISLQMHQIQQDLPQPQKSLQESRVSTPIDSELSEEISPSIQITQTSPLKYKQSCFSRNTKTPKQKKKRRPRTTYQCKSCPEQFKDEKLYDKHSKNVHGVQNHKCRSCDISFNWRKGLDAHRKSQMHAQNISQGSMSRETPVASPTEPVTSDALGSVTLPRQKTHDPSPSGSFNAADMIKSLEERVQHLSEENRRLQAMNREFDLQQLREENRRLKERCRKLERLFSETARLVEEQSS